MVWDQLDVNRPHVAYAVTAFAMLLFGTVSLFVKEKLYIGESTLSTIYGLIVGPHCLNWFNPVSWGNTDYITLELSRIVLVVQIFAVAVELPKKYMLKHWLSIFLLLVPVMTYGWLIGSVFIWKLVPTLRWIEALCIAACITATDPVLASAVVGKGKFARRVPGHLRNLLSAESGCNDGMAFPFIYLALSILDFERQPPEIAKQFIVISLLYECVFACIIGVVIGYGSRHLIKFAEAKNIIDRESFLVYYFCLALFCAGVGTMLGIDDLLVAFCAGAAFAWNGWFAKRTENSQVSNVIDLLLNTAYFIYFGAIIPWEKFNDTSLGISAWKLVILAIIILLVRRLPIILLLKPVIPDIKTWREAFFCGHFGPIGVGGLFAALVARADLETRGATPLAELPPEGSHHYYAIACIWPITCFMVLSSIIVHGSSVAIFTLGKRINNISFTMSYTTGGNGHSWLSRLPDRMRNDMSGGSSILRFEKVDTEIQNSKQRVHTRRPRKRRASEHRRARNEEVPVALQLDLKNKGAPHESVVAPTNLEEGKPEHLNTNADDLDAFQESNKIVFESDNGEATSTGVGHQVEKPSKSKMTLDEDAAAALRGDSANASECAIADDNEGDARSEITTNMETTKHSDTSTHSTVDTNTHISGSDGSANERLRISRTSTVNLPKRGEQVYAFQVDNDIIVENEEGEIIRRYRVHRRGESSHSSLRDKLKNLFGFKSQPDLSVSRRPSDRPLGVHQPTHADIENTPVDILEPIQNDGEDGADITIDEDREIQGRLAQLLDKGDLVDTAEERETHHESARPESSWRPSSQSADIDDESDYYYSGEEDDDEIPYQGVDDDDEEETAVERQRRLAALGVVPNVERTASRGQTQPARNGSRANIHPIPEEEEEPRITFSLPPRP